MPAQVVKSRDLDDYQITRYCDIEKDLLGYDNGQTIPRVKLPFENVKLRPGLEINIVNKFNSEKLKIGFKIEKPPISLSYNIVGAMRCTIIHGARHKTVLERKPSDVLLAYMPETKGVTESPSGRVIGLSIYFSQDFIREVSGNLPKIFNDIYPSKAMREAGSPLLHKTDFHWNTKSVLNQIIACPYHGNIRRIFLEAKSLELISIKMFEISGSSFKASNDLCRRELDLVREAYHILTNSLAEPPCLSDLSRMVGINRNKLNRGFKHLYGKTVFQVLRDARLATAWSMLRETELSLAEIANLVGYNDQANFTNAFRSHFGETPKKVRVAKIDQ
jgi:AraC-like DNA-binding protein